MAEPRTRPTDASVDEYIAAQPEARQADCRALVAMMSKASGAPAVMWGQGIVGFGTYPQTTADGKVTAWPRIGFASRKQSLTLYVVHDEALYAQLGPHTTSRACLYLKRLADVDTAVLEQVVDHTLATMTARYGPQ
jgi:hypothetical protein